MLAMVLYILAFSANVDSITIRKFSLVTDTGENVLHADFDRRRLAESIVHPLVFKFKYAGKQFEFEFERSYPIFAPGSTIKITGSVRKHAFSQFSAAVNRQKRTFIVTCQVHTQHTHTYIHTYTYTRARARTNKQGNGYLEVFPTKILSFSSPQNDAAITFINNTAVNGVVFQHSRAFDLVASADFLVVRRTQNMSSRDDTHIFQR